MSVITASFSSLDPLNIGDAVTIRVLYDSAANGTILYLSDDGVGVDEVQQCGTFDTGTEIGFEQHGMQAVDVVYTIEGQGSPFIAIADDVGNSVQWADGQSGESLSIAPPVITLSKNTAKPGDTVQITIAGMGDSDQSSFYDSFPTINAHGTFNLNVITGNGSVTYAINSNFAGRITFDVLSPAGDLHPANGPLVVAAPSVGTNRLSLSLGLGL